MFSIQDLLARHPIPGLKQSETRRECAEIISQTVGVMISPKAIQISEEIVSLSVPPVLKSAITMKQGAILAALAQKGIHVKGIR